MKIRLSLSDLNAALDKTSVVKPNNRNNESAYLFSLNEGKLHIHSLDGNNYVRVTVPIESSEGEGSFAYPSDRVEALKYLKGWVELEAGQDGDRFWVKYKTQGGATSNRSSLDPRLFTVMSQDFEGATKELDVPTAVLKEGISISMGYLSQEANNDKPFQTLQIFDDSDEKWAKGDGTMFAADGYRTCYFASDVFKGKGLAIHQKHVSRLVGFLSKCERNVRLRYGEKMTYVIDQAGEGAVFGWLNHTMRHPKYSAYPASMEKFSLLTPKDLVLESLRQIKAEMKSTKRERIRVSFANESLNFLGSVSGEEVTSVPVGVKAMPIDGVTTPPEFGANVNVNSLLGLFENARGMDVEFRVAIVERGQKSQALFRTVEKFWLNESGKVVIAPGDSKETCYECQVTHFTTSMD